MGGWTLRLETGLEGQGILDRRKGSLVSRGHSLGRGLEARRYSQWQVRWRRHWARGQGAKEWPAALSWGSLRPCVPSPKPRPVQESREVQWAQAILPAASTPFPGGSLEARREVCRNMTVHGSGMLDVEMCEGGHVFMH